jgi:DNA-binding LacI/PurR family transcriptional regulator
VPIHLTVEDIEAFMTRTNTPVAVLGQHIVHPHLDVVYVNDEQAIYDTTLWLANDCGHRKFGYIGVPDDLPPGPRRHRGFLQALQDLDLQIPPQHSVIGHFTMDSGRDAVHELLKAHEMPTALIVLNDLMAIGAILALQEAGYRVPEDVAVVGYDDIIEARIVRPNLTTIAQDSADIGRKLATCLFERIENPSMPGVRLESASTLIKRESA